MSARHVALIGLRCTGKSTVGRELARCMRLPFVDLDDELARGKAASAGELLAVLGVERFRDLEARALAELLARPARAVIATGGGAVERADSRDLLAANAACVWLTADLSVLRARLARDPTTRPALFGADASSELETLAGRREPLYAALAELVVDSGARAPSELADAIAEHFRAGD